MELNGIEPLSVIFPTDAHLNELLLYVSMVSIPQKNNFVKFILQKNLIFAKIRPTIVFFQRENRICRSVSEPAHLVPLVLKAIVPLLKTANPDGDERI